MTEGDAPLPIPSTLTSREGGSRPTPESVLGIANPLVVRVSSSGEVNVFKAGDQIDPGDQLRVVAAGLDIDGTSFDEERPEPERMATLDPAKDAVAALVAMGISCAPAT